MRAIRRQRRDILVITNWRDRKHPEAGGAEAVCERLARNFADRGQDVVLLTSSVEGEGRHDHVEGYKIVRRGGTYTAYLWALVWLLLHRSQVSAVVDSQNGIPFFTPLVVKKKTPVLMLIHHVHQDQFALYLPPLAARLGRWLESKGSCLVYRDRTIIAVSPSTRMGARRRLGLKGDIVVIPPGFETPVATLAPLKGRSKSPRIVCVGRLVAHKAVASIVAAVSDLLADFPDLELHIVGDGTERPAIEAMVEALELSGHVVIHGALSTPERDKLMRTAWMSVNASKGEGWGLSVVEANSLGVPVLAYQRPGLRDSIRDGETGWLLDDQEALAPAVASALGELEDEATAAAMGTRARQWAAQFTWEEMGDQVFSLLEAERGRLAHTPNNRRLVTDLASVVRVPTELLPNGKVPSFRSTDKCVMSEGDLVVLLRNTDTETAKLALRRAGFSPEIIDDPRVRISVARHVDLVSPAIATSTVVALAGERDEDGDERDALAG
jgi:glycosyltransferase involved in cell wall biosynthesis